MSLAFRKFNRLSAADIQKIVPHRYPFLLIDKIESVILSETSPVGDRVVGYKAVTQNEPFFQGHFPTQPVMPGVLILEAMLQASMLLCYRHIRWSPDQDLFYFTAVDKAKFRRPVAPGNVLRLEAEVKKVKQKKFWLFEAKAYEMDISLGGDERKLISQAQVSGAFIKGGLKEK